MKEMLFCGWMNFIFEIKNLKVNCIYIFVKISFLFPLLELYERKQYATQSRPHFGLVLLFKRKEHYDFFPLKHLFFEETLR